VKDKKKRQRFGNATVADSSCREPNRKVNPLVYNANPDNERSEDGRGDGYENTNSIGEGRLPRVKQKRVLRTSIRMEQQRKRAQLQLLGMRTGSAFVSRAAYGAAEQNSQRPQDRVHDVSSSNKSPRCTFWEWSSASMGCFGLTGRLGQQHPTRCCDWLKPAHAPRDAAAFRKVLLSLASLPKPNAKGLVLPAQGKPIEGVAGTPPVRVRSKMGQVLLVACN